MAEIKAVLSAIDRGFTAGIKRAAGSLDSLDRQGGRVTSRMRSGLGMGIMMGIGAKACDMVVSGFRAVTSSVDKAVSRADTLNNFPKIMGNLGYSTKDAAAAMAKMDKGIAGLPTSMDAIASATQKIAPLTGNLGKATDVTLALNNALLAGGKSTEAQANALEQFSQMLSAGKVDMQSWRSMLDAMPGQLQQLAYELVGPKKNTNDLYEAMKSGKVSFDDFNKALVKLNKDGIGKFASFAKQAKTTTQGIGTGIANLKTAVVKGVADMVTSADRAMKKYTGFSIADQMKTAGDKIKETFKKLGQSKGFAKGIAAAFIVLKSGTKVAFAFGRAIVKVGAAFVKSLGGSASFEKAVKNIQQTLSKVARFIEDHAEGIGRAGKALVVFFAAFKAYKAISGARNRLSSFIALAKGGEGIIGKLAKKTGLLTASTTALNTATDASELQLQLHHGAVSKSTEILAKLKGGIGGLASKMGMTTGGLAASAGIAAGAVVGLAAAAYKYHQDTTKHTRAADSTIQKNKQLTASAMAQNASIDKLWGKIKKLNSVENKSAKQKEKLKNYIDALNSAAPSLGIKYDEETGKIKNNIKAIEKRIEALKKQALAEAYQAQMKSMAKKYAKDEQKLSKAIDRRRDLQKQLNATSAADDEGRHAALQAKLQKTNDEIKDLTSSTQKYEEEMDKIAEKQTNVANGITFSVAKFEQLKNKVNEGYQFTDQFYTMFESGALRMPQTVEQMKNAMNLQDMSNKAGIEGKKIPESLANAMIAGKVAIPKATGQMKALVTNFSIDKGKLTYKGRAVPQSIAKGIASGQLQPKEAAERMQAYIKFTKATQGASGAGRKVASNLATAIANGKLTYKQALAKYDPLTKAAWRRQAQAAKSGAAESAGYGRSRGSEFGAGYVSGLLGMIGDVAAAASSLAAAANTKTGKKQKSGSPSKVAKKRGREWGAGYVIGIAGSVRRVRSGAIRLVNAARAAMKKDIAKQGLWKKSFVRSTDKAMSALTKALNKRVSKLRKSTNKKIGAWMKKSKKNKALRNAGNLLKRLYGGALKKESAKMLKTAKKSLGKLASSYQAAYDKIRDARNAMTEQLRAYGSLIHTDSYGFTTLTNFKNLIKQQNKIKAMLKTLQKYGVSRNFIDQISGLSVDEQVKVLNHLMGMSSAVVKQYAKEFDKYWKNAATISNDIYKPYVKQLNSKYKKQLDKEIKTLKRKFAAIGLQTGKGLVSGLNNKATRKKLNAVSKNLANSIIRQIKKSLKIHSPSKVMTDLGKNTGLGLAEGIAAMAKRVSQEVQNLVTIPRLVLSHGYDMGLSSSYDYSQYIAVQSDIYMDGKKVAEAVAEPMETELNKRQTRDRRKRGKR